MKPKPLLSIVVPTKDGYKYLKPLISLITSFNSNEIEVVLQDNTRENSEIRKFLENSDYKYIKYFHNSEQIPVSKNCDLAILNSTGEYVCMIGDDDGVTSHIADCVKWMKQHDVEALIQSIVSYHWPDFINSITGNISGTLSFKHFTKKYQFKDPLISLKDIMAKGFINRGELPLVYHGIVRRDVLEKIYKIGNTYFPGPSPDIANGVALSLTVRKFVQLDFPVIISGASKTHGGGIRTLKNKVADIENLPFLPKNAKENWENNIPKVWTGETVWPESAIKALRYMGRVDLIEKVNFDYMFAKFIVFHFPLRKMAIKLSHSKIKLIYFIVKIAFSRYYNAFKRLTMKKILGRYDGKNVISDINNIEEANNYLIEKVPKFKVFSNE